VVADGPLKNGLHHYGGWFFFVGEMLTVGEGLTLMEQMLAAREHTSEVCNSPSCSFFFTRVGFAAWTSQAHDSWFNYAAFFNATLTDRRYSSEVQASRFTRHRLWPCTRPPAATT
jgi:hypothetical protein